MPGLVFILFLLFTFKKKTMLQSIAFFLFKIKKKEKKAVTLSFLSRPLREKCTPVVPGPALVAKGNILTKQDVLYKMWNVLSTVYFSYSHKSGPDKWGLSANWYVIIEVRQWICTFLVPFGEGESDFARPRFWLGFLPPFLAAFIFS